MRERGIVVAIEIAPHFFHSSLEGVKSSESVDEFHAECRVLPHIFVVSAAIGVSEIPHRTEVPTLFVQVLVEIATAVESFLIIKDFLNDIESHEVILIEDGFPLGGSGIFFVRFCVDIVELVIEIGFLLGRKHLGGVVCNGHAINRHMGVVLVVVYLHQPSAGDFLRVGFLVGLLNDIHSGFVYANVFGEHIQPDVFAVEHHLHRLLSRSPRQPEHAAELKS